VPATLDPVDEALYARLQQPIDVDLSGLNVEQAVARLARELKLPLRISDEARREFGSRLHIEVDFPTQGLPLAVVLERKLPSSLACLVRHRELLISTAQEHDDLLHTRLYDVRQLVSGKDALQGDDRLVDLISSHVQPETWDDVVGPGAISCQRGVLVVTQTPEVHNEVAALLEMVGVTLHRPSTDNSPRSADDAVLAALARPAEIDVCETPLDEALRELSRSLGLPIWIDPFGLAEAGIKPDSPVTFAASGMTLSGVLDRLLRVELGYYVQCGELS